MRAALIALAAVAALPARADELAKYSADLAAAPAGRIYHYLRSNRDGTEPEQVVVFHKSPRELEVYKHVGRCNNAALVTAELDPVLPMATKLAGGRLRPNGEHVEFAWLTWDARAKLITAKVQPPGQAADLKTLATPDVPWHVFDFDLASLTVVTPRLKDPKAGFSFGAPLIWPKPEGWEFQNLGRADAVFEREETYAGRPALRFRVEGPAFAGGKGGPLWLDKADRHVLGAEWGVPNHAEYRDFKLVLEKVEDGGARTWDRLLRAHYENCPAS